MCGIVGILKLDLREQMNPRRLSSMRDVLFHRGPDDAGIWIDGPIGFGHRRLSIVDVAGGHQPMVNGNGRLCITFNGEIYNHPSLRRYLEARGHHYRTRSDTETILHLYEEEGQRCVEKLQGMFAFALWDRRENRLLLARDRLGIKPLYYSVSGREFVFGSEIKAILAGQAVRPAFNQAVLPEFLANRYLAGGETFFRGIRKLLPAHTLSWSPEEGFREERYWQPPAETDGAPRGLAESAREVRGWLQEVVESHLMSDVPVGVFLSGGIDSSGIAALMARLLPEPVRTFSVGFTERGANELGYARLVAESLGARHREVIVWPEKFFHELPRLIWHEDEPIAFASSIPLYFVSRLAREHVKVVLTGEGSDELFLGYNRYRVTAWNERLGHLYWHVMPTSLQKKMRAAIHSLPGSLSRYGKRTFLGLQPGLRCLLYENFATFPQSLQRQILDNPDLLDARDPYARFVQCYEEASGGLLARLSRTDLQTYLVELLMKQDQMSMAASIESRVPFLDHRFVERVAAMPGSVKLRGWRTKAVLREALADLLPHEILTRPKRGFPVPLGGWFRRDFWPLIQEFVLSPRALERALFKPSELRHFAKAHQSGTANYGDQLWLLLNLEIWQRIFIDGDEIAAITRRIDHYARPLG